MVRPYTGGQPGWRWVRYLLASDVASWADASAVSWTNPDTLLPRGYFRVVRTFGGTALTSSGGALAPGEQTPEGVVSRTGPVRRVRLSVGLPDGYPS